MEAPAKAGKQRTAASRITRWSLAWLAIAWAALVAAPAAQAFEQTLSPADAASLDEVGYAVAIDGDTAVVGAPGNSLSRGAVYVFVRVGNAWNQTAKLTVADGSVNDRLGTSVDIDGDTIVAGAPNDEPGAANTNEGAVYTFTRTGGNRTQTARLGVSDAAADDLFGTSVAIDGDTIVAGAPNDDPGTTNTNQGAAYTFNRTGGDRTETAKLTNTDPGGFGESFGFSVAIDGDTIVVGSPNNSDGEGAAYTFAATGAPARTETAKLTASDGVDGDRLGYSVAIDGNTIVAGAWFDDNGAGSAYTFARTGASRAQTAKLTASDGLSGDWLGWSVSVRGNTILVGALHDDVEGRNGQGSAYTFARTGSDRNETRRLAAATGAAEDNFGYSVAVGGDAFLVGARFDDTDAVNEGSATAISADLGAPCADGSDNDGDGFGDFPDDPGCASETDDSELDPAVACDDDADNDGDGLTDFPADTGCSSPTDTDETLGRPGDAAAPDTEITSAPRKSTRSAKARLEFTGTDDLTPPAELTFECKLDRKPYKPCRSPHKYKRLKNGKHKVEVRATDQAGRTDPSPAKARWRTERR